MTSRKARPQFTPVELEIMKVLWAAGASTVQEVRRKLPSRPKPAYTTVQTMLNVLHRKGSVKRILRGKAFLYQPRVTREGALSTAIRDVLERLFAGSAEDMVMTLVKDQHLTPEELARLERLVNQPPAAKDATRDAEGKG